MLHLISECYVQPATLQRGLGFGFWLFFVWFFFFILSFTSTFKQKP